MGNRLESWRYAKLNSKTIITTITRHQHDEHERNSLTEKFNLYNDWRQFCKFKAQQVTENYDTNTRLDATVA